MIKKIGERIRRIRTSKGYSQANIAEDIGITSGAYAKIERGETDASAGRLLRIAEILNVDIRIFFEEESMVAQKQAPYGYATKEEIDALHQQLAMLLKEIELLKNEINKMPAKKVKK